MKITKTILIIISLFSVVVMATPIDEHNRSKAVTFEEERTTTLKKLFTKKHATLFKKIAHKKFLKSFYKKITTTVYGSIKMVLKKRNINNSFHILTMI